MPMTFAQVSAILADANTIHPEKRDTFNSRLKQWQKMGFPDGVNVGRGVKAEYGAAQIYQLAIMIRLLRCGLTPERAQTIVNYGWPAFRVAIVQSTYATIFHDTHVYVVVEYEALTDLREPGSVDHNHVYIRPIMRQALADGFKDGTKKDLKDPLFGHFQSDLRSSFVSALVVEMSSLIWRVWMAMKKNGVPFDVLSRETIEWGAQLSEDGKREKATPFDPATDMPRTLPDPLAQIGSEIDLASVALTIFGGDEESVPEF